MNAQNSGSRRASLVTHALWLGSLILLASAALGTDPWPFLPNDDIGARDFKAAHPSFDGRGVVVAILDTGVDAFAPGLTQTSAGATKLIEVRDFSTQGNWKVVEPEPPKPGEPDSSLLRHPDGLQLRGADQLAVPPVRDDPVGYPVYLGLIREKQFQSNPQVEDLNDDGDTNDQFGFLVYAADRAKVEAALGVGHGYRMLMDLNETARQTVARERQSPKVWLVVVDSDGDGDLINEAILRDYRVNYDTFRLTSRNAPDAKTMMAWAVNVVTEADLLGQPQPPTVEFHFGDGSHGSHCAGIATGYRVSGQEGLDGVAPGAWLISLKIGDNRLSGGATRTESMKKAYEYAAEYEKKYGLPVVCSMSFGIASVEEGNDKMGQWLDDFLAEHPTLYVSTSAGNEGPGLSTIGLPATSPSVISSGAYLSVETGRSLYDAPVARPTLFTFSSRGGESAKPDVVAPGSALSTVPGYVEGSARSQGTSMAAPQTSGAVACLVSGALQEGLTLHWGMVKRALIAGAQPIEGLGLDDQGGGLVNMTRTWDVLKDLSASKSAHDLLGYRVETACPFQRDGQAEAAYWRIPGGVPLPPETVTFTVHPIFHPDLTPDQKDTFFRSFRFESEASWLKVIPVKRYIRGDMGMDVELRYDGRQLQKPGIHAARVIASLDSGDLKGLAAREFYLWNTVAVGDPLASANGYVRTYEGRDLTQSWVHHYFVDVPAGATALRARLEVSPRTGASKGARAAVQVCDPEGHVHGDWSGYATLEGDQIKDTTVLAPELYPGTWEVDVEASRLAKDATSYRLTVACDGYACQPAEITALPRENSGNPAKTTINVTRAFAGVFKGQARASIAGFRRAHKVNVQGTDVWSQDFTLDRQAPRATFHLEMDKETGNLFTDCAVNILDDAGKAVVATGFSGLVVDIAATLPEETESVTYTLQVVGGFALAQDARDWSFDLEEKYMLAQPVSGAVARAGGGDLQLFCGVPTALDVSFADSWPAPPSGLHAFGTVLFLDENVTDKAPGDEGGRPVLEVPIRLD